MYIKKAIIPVAGLGTRFLPATKAQPKEMLPVVDKPVIQYLVEEAVASGIREIIFVTSLGKRAIEDHFDYSYELIQKLAEKKKFDLLESVKKISQLASFAYVRQPEPLGDGHAILMAKHLVGCNEPVAVLFGDDLVDSEVPCLKQLMDVFYKYNDPVVALVRVPKKEVSRYGVVDSVKVGERIFEIKKFVEKPAPEAAPSNLIAVGKYIITPEIFEMLADLCPDKSGEIRLADAFSKWVETRPMYGCEFEGTRYDCGDKLGFLKATVDFGLKHPELKEEFREYLKGMNL